MTTAFAGTAWGGSDYYSTARVSLGPTGEGKVYVSKNNPTNNPQYSETGSAQNSDYNNQDHKYYLYAQANPGYYFEGWYLDDVNCTGTALPAESPDEVTIHVNNRGSNNTVVKTWYANFLPKHDVVFNDITIPYGASYTITKGTGTDVDVQTDTDGSVEATNSVNTAVATVSGSTITPAAVGTTTITITAAEGATYLAGGPTEITVNVTAPEGLSEGEPSTPETYTIPSSGIGSYCSMYPLDLSKLPSGVNAYAVWQIKDNTLARMTDITGTTIKGGVGFVLKGEPGTVVTFSYADSDNVPSNLLHGTLAPTYVAAGTVYGLSAGKFQPNLEGVIPAHKAYLSAESNPTKALVFEFEEDDPTGIEEFNFEEDTNGIIYNLSGQRINKMQKGLNIVNGKKILK